MKKIIKQKVKLGRSGSFEFTGLDGQKYKLTGKQKKFSDAYFGKANFNAAEACRIAEYGGKGEDLRKIGWENTTKLDIKKYFELILAAQGFNDEVVRSRHLDNILKGDMAAINTYYRLKGQFRTEQEDSESNKKAAEALAKIGEAIDKLE